MVWRGEDAVAISWTKERELSDGWVPPLPPGEIATQRQPNGCLVRNDISKMGGLPEWMGAATATGRDCHDFLRKSRNDN